MKTAIKLSRLTIFVLGILVLGIWLPAFAAGSNFPISAIPIPPQPGARPVPFFIGHEAVEKPITTPAIPQNPFMSSGAWSNIHNDSYMSDTYFTSGPLGKSPIVSSTFLGTSKDNPLGLVVTMTFDSAGRLVAGVNKMDPVNGTAWVRLVLIDPGTLAPLAWLDLPKQAMNTSGHTGFRPAGAYFFQDNLGRIIVGTSERSIWVVSHTASAFTKDQEFDLTGVIPADDELEALQTDWYGRLWFSTDGGVVGVLDTSKATDYVLGSLSLPEGEEIVNSTTADETGGVFIASTRALYRFDADQTGAPSITWREPYDAGTHVKSGQVNIGTGTTPTLMGEDFITIADNAEPQMHVLVYRRAKDIQGSRLVCAEPVFKPGPSSTENSLVATDRSIVVENNFGYKDYSRTDNGSTTKPGIARIDINADGNGCHTVWSNMDEIIPSLVTKMSLKNGLIYTYTKPKGPANTDAWYFTAIDFESGQVVYKVLAGTGLLYNNHYAALYLGPDGTAYVGIFGGLVTIRDGQ